MPSRRIVTTDLDFDQIKQNIKKYFQGQEQFTDYDFEGSGLSILIDVLAYNTHYNALYLNLALNETFLDSAVKRNSVVSKAKELGYVPMSSQCATAIVNVQMINNRLDAPETLEMAKYTPFVAKQGDYKFTFYTQNSQIASKYNNQYNFENVVLKEGTPTVNTIIWDGSSKVTIPNYNVDITTLKVLVQESTQSTTYTTFNLVSTIANINNTTPVYFINEIENQYFELQFGDGILGKALEIGNVIRLEYMVTGGDIANGVYSFQYNGGAVNNTQIYTTTVQVSSRGAPIEDIESIKWNAPRYYAAQDRCVTADDYKSMIYRLYPTAKSVNIWGGEQNNPPSYGDVFISIQPDNNETLSEAEKQYIMSEIIEPRKLVTIHPKFVDPIHINISMDVNYYYDIQKLRNTVSDLSTRVFATVFNFGQTNLNKFGGIMKYSKLTRAIDDTDQAITSSIVTLKLHQVIAPIYNQQYQYVINMGNPIYNSGEPEQSVITTGVILLSSSDIVYFDDLPIENSNKGYMRMYTLLNNQRKYIKNVGTVDYLQGIITLNDIVITGLETGSWTFIIKPQSNDVVSRHNEIVNIPQTLIRVIPVQDKPADQYTFSSSRN